MKGDVEIIFNMLAQIDEYKQETTFSYTSCEECKDVLYV